MEEDILCTLPWAHMQLSTSAIAHLYSIDTDTVQYSSVQYSRCSFYEVLHHTYFTRVPLAVTLTFYNYSHSRHRPLPPGVQCKQVKLKTSI